MPVELASAYVSIIPTTKGIGADLERELSGPLEAAAKKAGDTTGKSLDETGKKFTKFGIGALAVAGVVGAGLLKTGQSASDLGESVNAVRVTFGDAAEGILKLGEDAATSVGLSNTAFNGLAVQFSSFATTIAGKGGDVVGVMSEMTGRAADFASVMNIEVADAAAMFQSGLAGETEPLKKFGIDLSAAAVNAFAAAHGIGEVGKELTESEKVTARYGLLMESTAKTQGDFANTSDSAANAMRIAKAEMENAAASLGTALTPIMATAAQTVGKLATGFADLNEKTDGWLGKGLGIATVALGAAGGLSMIVGQAIKMRASFTTLKGVLVDTEGGLTKVGTAAKWSGIAMGVAGAAILVATAYYSDNARKKAILVDITNQFTEALKKEAEGQKGAVDEAIAAQLSNRKLIEQAETLGLTVSDLADLVAGKQVPAWEKWKDVQDHVGFTVGAFGPKADMLKTNFAQVEAALAPMTRGLSDAKDGMVIAAQVTDELDSATRSWRDGLPEAEDAVADAAAATDGLTVAGLAGKGALEGIAAATAEATRKSDVYAASLQTQLDKLDQLYPAQYDAVQAKYDYADSQAVAMVAVDALNTTLGDHKAKQEDVKSATDAARDAILDQSEKYATLDGAALGSQGAIQRQIQSLEAQRDTLAPGSPLRAFLDQYIADLAAIPSNISTIMDLHISSGQVTTKDGDVIGKRTGARARGGYTDTPWNVINEEGAELVKLPMGSYVATAAATRSLMAGSGMSALGESWQGSQKRMNIERVEVHNDVDADGFFRYANFAMAS